MKKMFVYSLALILVVGSLCQGAAAQNRKKEKLAIMPFSESGSKIQGAGAAAADVLIEVLVKNKRFSLIEREQLDAVIKEQKLGMTGLIDDATAAQVGRLLGVKYMIFGNVNDASAKKTKKVHRRKNQPPKPYWEIACNALVTCRVIDIETGEILFAGKEKRRGTKSEEYRGEKKQKGGAAENALARIALKSAGIVDKDEDINAKYQSEIIQQLRNATYLFRDDIANIFPLTGYVIKIETAEYLYIDLGKDAGMKKKKKLHVVRQGPGFKHPVTGVMLPGTKEKLGKIEICEDPGDDYSKCKVKDKKLKGKVKLGDIVEAEPEKVGFWEQMGNK